jgi:hypothetical protein
MTTHKNIWWKQKSIDMDPHPLANLFKRSNYDEPIASELSALDYLYEVLLENHESENCDEVLEEEIYKVIHDSSLIEKHDCTDVIINSINVNCANYVQSYELGDENFVISTTYCNDHDWGDNASYDLENLFKPHDEYSIDNNVCNNIESGFGRVSTLGKNNPTYLESVQSYEIFDKSGIGEVMTIVDVNPTILETIRILCMWIIERKFYMIAILLNLIMILHVIIMREENMVVEIFILLNYLSLC